MKAVILAAGKGSRIHPLTDGKPKSLLPFGDTTLLGHSLRMFKQVGIEDVIIVTGFQRHHIINYANAIWEKPIEYVYNPFYDQTNVLYSFSLALPWIGDDDIIFLHADTVFSSEILQNIIAEDTKDLVFAIDKHKCEEEEMKVCLDGNIVKNVTKNMPPENADGEFLGLAKIKNHTLKLLKTEAENLFEKGELLAFFELAVQGCIDKNMIEVNVCDVTGHPWQEVDFEEDYRTALSLFGL